MIYMTVTISLGGVKQQKLLIMSSIDWYHLPFFDVPIMQGAV